MATVRMVAPGLQSVTSVVGALTYYPSAGPETPALSEPGRTYVGSPGTVLDVPEFDAAPLQAQGWFPVCFGLPALKQGGSGPTANRPANPLGGKHYFDTTLGKLAVWDGAAWRDPGTGNSI